MGRSSCCDKSNVKKGLWTAEEDAKILAYVSSHGVGNWTLIPKKAGLNRCGKSCRLRWTNYLRPDLKHESFSPEEEKLIIQYHEAIGSRWSLIARHLPGRTDNDVKNYWNTKLKKKLIKMGIDPVTHKPVSRVLSEFGSISGSWSSATPAETYRKNLNGLWISKPESSNSVLIRPNSSYPTFFELSSSKSFPDSRPEPSFKTTQTQGTAREAPTFSWSEFLVTDPTAPPDLRQQEKPARQEMFLQGSNFSDTTENQKDSRANGNREAKTNVEQSSLLNNNVGGDSPSSFVEAILDRDEEIRTDFPRFLDDYYDYY